jgi:hypothetical protein
VIRKSLILVAAALAVAPPALSGSLLHRPALRVTSLAPLRVVGTRFVARERVRVTATVDTARSSRLVRASSTGTFAATFADLTADRCVAYVVRAVGASGDVAVVKARPLCAPA